jgi:hypothetical protein
MSNEQKEVTEVTMFDKVYKTKNLTPRITQSFVAIQRMDEEANEANYQAVKAASAVEFQKQQLQTMIEEDEIECEEGEIVAEESEG